MYARILNASFRRAPRRKLLVLAALVIGSGTTTGLAGLALNASDRISAEFRSIGANIRVLPEVAAVPLAVSGAQRDALPATAFLTERQVVELLEPRFFWRPNVVALTPLLNVEARVNGAPARLTGAWFARSVVASDGRRFVTGLEQVYPSWRIRGRWPRDSADEIVLGSVLAGRLGAPTGARVTLALGQARRPVVVAGIADAGGPEDVQAFATLGLVQGLAGRPGLASESVVSAVTTPESRLSRIAGVDPSRLSPQDYDRWYCTNYPSAIARRIEETLPGTAAMPLRRAAEPEGRVLGRLQGLMVGAALATLFTAALGILSTVWMTLLERRAEIGLLRALGAEGGTIRALFLAETLLIGFGGGVLGWGVGQLVGGALSQALYDRPAAVSLATLPLAVGASLLSAGIATWPPVRAALRWEPVAVLRGR